MNALDTSRSSAAAQPKAAGWRQVVVLLGEYGFIVIFIVLALYLTVATRNFATEQNLFTILRQATITGILAIGAHFIILLGDIDLSPAAVLSLSGVAAAWLMVNQSTPALLAVLIALGIGGLVGLINGLIVTQLKINAIITTLGTAGVLGGLSFIITDGRTVFGDSLDAVEFLSRGTLFERIPIPVVILFAAYLIAFLVLRYTTFGAKVFAVGNNDRAAFLSGISVTQIKILTFVLAGVLAAFAGIMQVARQGTATAGMGEDFLFPTLTAVVLGGASLKGGRGKIVNTLIAAVFLTTITNGMVLLSINIYTQRVISGAILIVALSLDRLRTLRR